MPAEVDTWPVGWSGGWLLERVLELEAVLNGGEQWKDGVGIGFGLADPDYDPAFDAPAEPPPGYELLPFDGGGD